MTMHRSTTFRAGILQGLLVATLMLVAAFGLKHSSPTHLSPELAHRLLGILIAVPALIYANAAPKALSPLTRMRCDPTAEQALRRFSGWTLTLGALAYTAAWAFAPLDRASILATSLLGASVLLVIARIAWSMWRRPRITSSHS